jgi:hypothetical protein
MKILGSFETSGPRLLYVKMKTLESLETSRPGLPDPEDEGSRIHRNVGTRTAWRDEGTVIFRKVGRGLLNMKTKTLGHSNRRDQGCLTEDEGSGIFRNVGTMTAWPWRWNYYELSKRQELFTQRSSWTFQKTTVLIQNHYITYLSVSVNVICIGRTAGLKAERLTSC